MTWSITDRRSLQAPLTTQIKRDDFNTLEEVCKHLKTNKSAFVRGLIENFLEAYREA